MVRRRGVGEKRFGERRMFWPTGRRGGACGSNTQRHSSLVSYLVPSRTIVVASGKAKVCLFWLRLGLIKSFMHGCVTSSYAFYPSTFAVWDDIVLLVIIGRQ